MSTATRRARRVAEVTPVSSRPRITGSRLGRVTGISANGRPMVELLDEPGYPPTEARCTIELDAKGIGRSVALVFENGDARSPIVIGELPPVAAPSANDAVVFDFDRNVVFRCGEASITLTPAGKVLIQGKFVLTHSSGLNRIRGAAVQIN